MSTPHALQISIDSDPSAKSFDADLQVTLVHLLPGQPVTVDPPMIPTSATHAEVNGLWALVFAIAVVGISVVMSCWRRIGSGLCFPATEAFVPA